MIKERCARPLRMSDKEYFEIMNKIEDLVNTFQF